MVLLRMHVLQDMLIKQVNIFREPLVLVYLSMEVKQGEQAVTHRILPVIMLEELQILAIEILHITELVKFLMEAQGEKQMLRELEEQQKAKTDIQIIKLLELQLLCTILQLLHLGELVNQMAAVVVVVLPCQEPELKVKLELEVPLL